MNYNEPASVTVLALSVLLKTSCVSNGSLEDEDWEKNERVLHSTCTKNLQ